MKAPLLSMLALLLEELLSASLPKESISMKVKTPLTYITLSPSILHTVAREITTLFVKIRDRFRSNICLKIVNK